MSSWIYKAIFKDGTHKFYLLAEIYAMSEEEAKTLDETVDHLEEPGMEDLLSDEAMELIKRS